LNRASPPSRKRILVVDDSSLVRLYYRDTLEKAGFEVEQAINGIEAMEKVLVQPFDLAIVDVNMPRMDGFSFLRTLRSSPGDVATLPALVITTEAGEQDVAAARAAGANFYLVKPLSQQDLLRHAAALSGAPPVNALHEQFIAEARELIHQATDDLIAVEREGFAPERIDRVFRAFHTLKGSGGGGRSAGDGCDIARRRRPARRDPRRKARGQPRRSSTKRSPVSIRLRDG
jgi:two-component system chemotaxis response regulator CheY